VAAEAPKSAVVVYAALAANVTIAATKFVVAAITGSSAMLSEGIHSTVDTGNQILLLIGLRRSRRPPDEAHPYGHGKEVFFWGLIVAVALFGIGGGMSFYEGVTHLRHPHPVGRGPWTYVVLGVSFVCEGTSLTVAVREFRRERRGRPFWEALRASKDPSIYTTLAEDSAAIAGLLVALAGIGLGQYLHNPYLDGAASVVIGVILAVTALLLARESRGLLIGESAAREVVEGIRSAVTADRAVVRVREMLTMQLGPEGVLVNLGVEFRRELSGAELTAAIARLDASIRARYPVVSRLFIEAEAFRGSAGADRAPQLREAPP
jgi:cation diffusion facilitator family transporter